MKSKRTDARQANGCPLVLVEWVDSVQPQPSWQHLADFDAGSVIECASVGWLLHDGTDVKALAPNIAALSDESQVQASGIIRIPACSVIRVVRLRERA